MMAPGFDPGFLIPEAVPFPWRLRGGKTTKGANERGLLGWRVVCLAGPDMGSRLLGEHCKESGR